MHFDHHVAVPDPATGPAVYRQHARTWLRANLPEFMRSDSPEWRTPTLAESSAWEAAMYQAGLAGMTWPKTYGGHGLTLREHLAVNKEIGALPMPESVSSIGKELAGPIIMAVGTEAQKQAFLPNILAMKQYWCQGFSEPDAGSDLARLRTKAVQEGDHWRINGQKIWTSGAAKAHDCLLLARTGTVADKHRGLVMFAVPMDTPGIRVAPIKSIDGKSSFAEVFFDDVVVPDSARLGAPDEGWNAAIRVLSIERATNRMYRPWRFECELRQLIAACKSDRQLAVTLDDGYFQRRVGDLVGQIDGLKGLVELTVERMMRGETIGARGSLTKLYWSECHQAFADLALSGTPHATTLVRAERLAGIAWQGSVQSGHARVDQGPVDWLLVADGDGASLLDLSAAVGQDQACLDPKQPQTWFELQGTPVLARLDAAAWVALQHRARILLAEFANGAAEGALQAAATYMATRVQFGRPLSTKQAVRHLLARMRLLQDVSSAAIRRATLCDEYGAQRDDRPALVGALGNAAYVIEKAIHLHGGMGFTWELPLHRALRAVRKLDAAFGGLSRDTGRAYIQSV